VKHRILFRSEVEVEITEAAEWYEARGRGLGADLVRAFDAELSSIDRNPLRYRRIHGEARRAPLRRFPYGIIYTVTGDEILVVACIHVRRDPESWQRRL
jgi:plasmid stabilization system protein ParE